MNSRFVVRRWSLVLAASISLCAATARAQDCDPNVRLCVHIESDRVGPSEEELERERAHDRQLERYSNSIKRWRFVQGRDRNGGVHCWARSPPTFVGSEGDQMYFASLRIMGTWEKPQVAIRSERGFDRTPPLFHTKVRDLGIQVGDYAQVVVDRRLTNSVVLAFTPQKSAYILSALHESRGYRLRLRFWPSERMHHSPPMSLEGFQEAFEKVNDCYE